MLTGLATSIDAMAIGVGLAFLDVPILPVAAAMANHDLPPRHRRRAARSGDRRRHRPADRDPRRHRPHRHRRGDPGRASRPDLTAVLHSQTDMSATRPNPPSPGARSASSASARWGAAWPGRCAAPATELHVFDVRAEASRSVRAPRAASPARRRRARRAPATSWSRWSSTPRRPRRCCSARAARPRRMRPGSVFVMCSTVDPNWSIALEGAARSAGPALPRRADLRRRRQGGRRAR